MMPRSPQFFRPGVETLEDRYAPAALIASGAGPGLSPRVHVYDAETQELKFDILAFSPGFRGGVNVAVGDVNGDGTPDIIAAVAGGAAAQIKVFDGTTGQQLAGPLGSFLAFDARFRGGANVATGDVNGDDFADILVGAGQGAAPRVKVYSGADGSVLANFLAFESRFKGGVRVAAGDFRHRHAADLAVAAGPGAAPRVRLFAGDTLALLDEYDAFHARFRGGVFIGTGDIDHDGTIDVIAGSGVGGGGQVKVFSGLTGGVINDFNAASPAYAGAVRVDAVDADNDTFEDILVGLTSSVAPLVKVFDGTTGVLLESFSTFGPRGGSVSVAGDALRVRGQNPLGTANTPITVEIPVLERLGRYVAADTQNPNGQFVPVTAGSIPAGKNVYFIAHGWAPGYRPWVNKYLNATPQHVLKWWETAGYGDGAQYPAPSPNPGPDSKWLYDGYSESKIPISPPNGLASQILKADPNAVVIAYSWIDDSATTAVLDNAIPEQAYLSEALTNINGMRLAKAIQEALGAGYTGKVHLLGHSHGSKVATLAALALHQSGGLQASQLTIFDSPESATPDAGNATNYNWHFLQQLNLSKTPGAGLFVDNYFSAFGVAYEAMTIGEGNDLTNLIDTQLYAYPYSVSALTDPGEWHSYPPAWYAQANAQPNTDSSYTNGGLAWSPLLGNNPSNVAAQWQQKWGPFTYSAATQAALEPSSPVVYSVTFDSTDIKNSSTGQSTPSFTLGLAAGQQQKFKGTYTKDFGYSGLAFDYQFSGADRGILMIQINGYLAYYIDSQYVPAGVKQQVTMNMAWPSLTHTITVTLLPPAGVLSTASVTVGNFRQFDVSDL